MPDCHRKLFQYVYSGNQIILREPCLRIECETCILNLNRRCLQEIVSPILLDFKHQAKYQGKIELKRKLISEEQLSKETMRTMATKHEECERPKALRLSPRFRKRMVLRFYKRRSGFAGLVRDQHCKVGRARNMRFQFESKRACFKELVARLSAEREGSTEKQTIF